MNKTEAAAHPGPSLAAMLRGIAAAAWSMARGLWRQRATALVPGITPDEIEPEAPASRRRPVRRGGTANAATPGARQRWPARS